ncbi:lipoprotein 17-related variable surface protein [Mycoplasmopsis lipofaciens]|uniref:lipoprotein 17-related variable surface protein n=1 Tax=Mycoplasmopsis lipofaciens TaxID=114884 RepID=UPI000489B5B7|nr:lipoprotein 17-related variable surface protein [Mycoplasmopsis lipofaciens]
MKINKKRINRKRIALTLSPAISFSIPLVFLSASCSVNKQDIHTKPKPIEPTAEEKLRQLHKKNQDEANRLLENTEISIKDEFKNNLPSTIQYQNLIINNNSNNDNIRFQIKSMDKNDVLGTLTVNYYYNFEVQNKTFKTEVKNKVFNLLTLKDELNTNLDKIIVENQNNNSSNELPSNYMDNWFLFKNLNQKYTFHKEIDKNNDLGSITIQYWYETKEQDQIIKSELKEKTFNGFLTTLLDKKNKTQNMLNSFIKNIKKIDILESIDKNNTLASTIKNSDIQNNDAKYSILIEQLNPNDDNGEIEITFKLQSKEYPELISDTAQTLKISHFLTNAQIRARRREEIKNMLNAFSNQLNFDYRDRNNKNSILPSLVSKNDISLTNLALLPSDTIYEIVELTKNNDQGNIIVTFLIKKDNSELGTIISDNHQCTINGFLTTIENEINLEQNRLINLQNDLQTINLISKNANEFLPSEIVEEDFNLNLNDAKIVVEEMNPNDEKGQIKIKYHLITTKNENHLANLKTNNAKEIILNGFLTTNQRINQLKEEAKNQLDTKLENVTITLQNLKNQLPSFYNSLSQFETTNIDEETIVEFQPNDELGKLIINLKFTKNDSELGVINSKNKEFVLEGLKTKLEHDREVEQERLNKILDETNTILLKNKTKNSVRPSEIDIDNDFSTQKNNYNIVINSHEINNENGTISLLFHIQSSKSGELADIVTREKTILIEGFQTNSQWKEKIRQSEKNNLNDLINQMNLSNIQLDASIDKSSSLPSSIQKNNITFNHGLGQEYDVIYKIQSNDDLGQLLILFNLKKHNDLINEDIESIQKSLTMNQFETTAQNEIKLETERLNGILSENEFVTIDNSQANILLPNEYQANNFAVQNVQNASITKNIISTDNENGSLTIRITLTSTKNDNSKDTSVYKDFVFNKLLNNETKRLNESVNLITYKLVDEIPESISDHIKFNNYYNNNKTEQFVIFENLPNDSLIEIVSFQASKISKSNYKLEFSYKLKSTKHGKESNSSQILNKTIDLSRVIVTNQLKEFLNSLQWQFKNSKLTDKELTFADEINNGNVNDFIFVTGLDNDINAIFTVNSTNRDEGTVNSTVVLSKQVNGENVSVSGEQIIEGFRTTSSYAKYEKDVNEEKNRLNSLLDEAKILKDPETNVPLDENIVVQEELKVKKDLGPEKQAKIKIISTSIENSNEENSNFVLKVNFILESTNPRFKNVFSDSATVNLRNSKNNTKMINEKIDSIISKQKTLFLSDIDEKIDNWVSTKIQKNDLKEISKQKIKEYYKKAYDDFVKFKESILKNAYFKYFGLNSTTEEIANSLDLIFVNTEEKLFDFFKTGINSTYSKSPWTWWILGTIEVGKRILIPNLVKPYSQELFQTVISQQNNYRKLMNLEIDKIKNSEFFSNFSNTNLLVDDTKKELNLISDEVLDYYQNLDWNLLINGSPSFRPNQKGLIDRHIVEPNSNKPIGGGTFGRRYLATNLEKVMSTDIYNENLKNTILKLKNKYNLTTDQENELKKRVEIGIQPLLYTINQFSIFLKTYIFTELVYKIHDIV